MKRLLFLSSAFMVIAFASCSKSSSAPPPGQESDTFNISYPVFVGANSTTSTPGSISLSNILSSANQDKISFISVSTLSRAQSYISFTGIPAGATLSNISFATDDKVINSGVLQNAYGNPLVISKDTTLTADSYTTILGEIGDYLVSKKSIKLTATYTAGSTPITNGTIKLHLSTVFNWQ